MLDLDYEKCFDRIEYKAVFGALRYFSFGEKFIKMCRLFFTDFKANVQNGGYVSQSWFKERGVNQGCPISPYLFLVCSEVMAHKIKEHPNIEGITIGQVTHVISQFADDTMLFLKYDRISLNATLEVLQYIEINTGLKISYEKSTVYKIGNCRDTDAKFYTQKQLQWSSGDIETLGISIANAAQQSGVTYCDTIQKMCDILTTWWARSLTLAGRVLIVNTLCASLFVYKLTVLPNMSDRQLKKTNKIINIYLWKKKRAKIPIRVLQNPKYMGGLQLCNFEYKQRALKTQWVRHILLQPSFEYAYEWLVPCLKEKVWEANISPEDINKMQLQSTFWKEVWVEWAMTHHTTNIEDIVVNDEMIWLNSNIRINDSVVFYKKAYNAGIVYIKDIKVNNELCTYTEIIEKYGYCMTWLDYTALLYALPRTWKLATVEGTLDRRMSVQKIIKSKKCVKKVYDTCIYIDSAKTIDTYRKRLNVEIEVDYDLDEYCKLFRNIYTVTNITKFRDFQYRLLLLKVPTNNILYHWKVKITQQCDYCSAPYQNIKHLFYDCPYTKKIWDFIEGVFTEAGVQGQFAYSNILTSTITPKMDACNFVCIVVKQYIYRCKCQTETPTIEGVRRTIQEIYKVEWFIAKSKGRLDKHQKKWKYICTDLFELEELLKNSNSNL